MPDRFEAISSQTQTINYYWNRRLHRNCKTTKKKAGGGGGGVMTSFVFSFIYF